MFLLELDTFQSRKVLHFQLTRRLLSQEDQQEEEARDAAAKEEAGAEAHASRVPMKIAKTRQ